MPAGRPPIAKGATKFMNSKRRVIFMTANGKYIAKSAKGATVYNPKARYVKSPGGTERSVRSSNARIPTAIRPKAVRKVRANRGVARGAYAGVKAGALPALFASMSPAPARRRGRPRKAPVASLVTLARMFATPKKMRKQRKNKGMKRGPRAKKM